MIRSILGKRTLVCLILVVAGKLWAACVDAPAGLVSWWPGEGNGIDVIGGNPATVNSGVSYRAGEVGQAFNFDGTSGSILVPASASLDVGAGPGFTVECWINPADLMPLHPIAEWNDGSRLGVHLYHSTSWCGDHYPGNLLANIVDTAGNSHPIYSGPGLLTTSNFQHVALTYDKASGIATLYINGAIVGNANLGSFTPQTSYNLYLGQRPGAGYFYSGLMDEVSLYGRALSQTEIQAIYQARSAGKCQAIAPFILAQPTDQTVRVGASASFSVSVGGSAPLSFQWRFEGNSLSGATGSGLTLTNVQLTDAGSYSVAVSNPVGSVISSNAVLSVTPAVCTNPPAGLVSWWAGEDNGNDVMGSNPATVNSGVTYTPGEVGQAFSFNGTSGSIVVPASASLNVGAGPGFTVECWIKPTDFTPLHPIVEWNSGSTFGVHFYHSTSWFGDNIQGNLLANIVDTSGRFHAVYSAGGLLTTSNLQHVALTYDKVSGVGKLYINGAVVGSANLGSFTPQTSYNLYLGQRPGAGYFYGGLMDEVSLYGRALSQTEIQTIYQADSSGKCQGIAPFIITQPVRQTVAVGANVTFSVSAGGSAPLNYQWRFDGTNLSGATGAALSLTNVQLSDAGNYSVVVSNAIGSTPSSNAVLTVSTGACAAASSGLVSWWAGEGNGNDVIGSNPATVNSGVTYSPGEVGQAFSFNGTSGSILVPASASLNIGAGPGFTVECWIKPTDFTPLHPIVEWNSGSTFGVHFYHSTSWFGDNVQGNLLANIVDTSGGFHPVYSADGLLTTSNFQHVALTYDKVSGIARLYINGAMVGNANLGSFTPQTSYNLYLGQRPGAGYFYSGLMDEVSLYGRALSQTEIQAIYQADSSGKCQGIAPFIITQPVSQTMAVGANVTFSVNAGGSAPLNYQWRFDGTNLSGATGSALSLTNVQLSDAGDYSVVVSNGVGSVTSSNASLTVTTGACVNVPGAIVGWWAGEGNGNNVMGSNPATVNSGVSYSPGEVGQAFSFNGTSGSILVPASASLNVGAGPGFSVECWIKPTDFTPLHPIVEWNSGSTFGVHFYHSTSWFGDNIQGNLLANIVDTSGGFHPVYSAAGLLTTSNLQHVALTYDKVSGVGKLYINGAMVGNANLGSFTPQTSYNLYLGQRPGAGYFYGGLMDEVSLYGRALSQTEIQAIYQAGNAGKCHPNPPIAVHNGVSVQPMAGVAGGYQISFRAIPNQGYVIERAPSLNGPWMPQAAVLGEANGTGRYVDTNAPSNAAFYRVVAQ